MRVLLAVIAALGIVALACSDGNGGEATPTSTARPEAIPALRPGLPFAPRLVPTWVEVPTGAPFDRGEYVVDIVSGTRWRIEPTSYPEPGKAATAFLMTWSPKGEAIVSLEERVGEESRYSVYVAAPGDPFEPLPHLFQYPVRRLVWSPDGRFLAGSGGNDGAFDRQLRVRDLEQGRVRLELGGSPHSWSGNSRFLTIINHSVGRGVGVWDSETYSMPSVNAADFAWSHSGARLAYIPAPSVWSDQPQEVEVRVRDFTTGADMLLTTMPGLPRSPLSWSADDAFLAMSFIEDPATGRVKTYIIDVARGAATVAISGSVSAGWSSRTDTLLFSGNYCGEIDIFTVEADGSNLRNYTRSKDADMFPHWSPDGTRVTFISYSSGGAVLALATIPQGEVIDLIPAAPRGTLEPLEAGWSPDSRYIVFTPDSGFGWCEGEEPQTTEVEILP